MDVEVEVVVVVVVEPVVEGVARVVGAGVVVELAFPFDCGIEGMHPLKSKSEVIKEARSRIPIL